MDGTGDFIEQSAAYVANLGSALFTAKHYNRMHAYVVGEIARAAFSCGLGVAVDLVHELKEPYQAEGKKRRQLHAKPDVTLYLPDSKDIWGLAEYESIDINGTRLAFKRHLLTNWPPLLPALQVILVVMTVPHARVWGDTPSRQDLMAHRDRLIEETKGNSCEYSFMLVDPESEIDVTRFSRGQVTGTLRVLWAANA